MTIPPPAPIPSEKVCKSFGYAPAKRGGSSLLYPHPPNCLMQMAQAESQTKFTFQFLLIKAFYQEKQTSSTKASPLCSKTCILIIHLCASWCTPASPDVVQLCLFQHDRHFKISIMLQTQHLPHSGHRSDSILMKE